MVSCRKNVLRSSLMVYIRCAINQFLEKASIIHKSLFTSVIGVDAFLFPKFNSLLF